VFFQVFRRYWPDCPFRVFLGTNHLGWDDPGVTVIRTGADTSWAAGVLRMLDALDTEHVILFLEDFLLQESVRSSEIMRLVRDGLEADVGCVRLSPLPAPSPPPPHPMRDRPWLGVVPRGTLYRVSAQPAIWRTDVLRRYLVPGFTPWEFELLGTQMSEFTEDTFWGPYEPAIVYDHAIEKGLWRDVGLEICRRAGVAVDLGARGRQPAGVDRDAWSHGPDANVGRLRAVAAFGAGRRFDGIRSVGPLLARRPWATQLWAISAFGMMGPRAFAWLRRQNLRRRIAAALRRDPLGVGAPVSRFI
jgi:hypothetical protein